MDKISVLSLITVSFPEALLFTIMSLLAIAKINYLKNYNNYIRIFLFIVITIIISAFVRSLVSNVVENLLISFFVISLLLIFILRLKFYESIMASLFYLIMIVLIESLYVDPYLKITGLSMNQIYDSDLQRFLITIPERAIQGILIFLSIKFNIKIIDFENTNIKKRDYYVQLFVYILSTGTLIFLLSVITKTLLFDHGNFSNSTNTLLLRLNLYITVFVTVILLLAIKSTNDFYKKKNNLNNNEILQSLDYISDLINEEKYIDAENSIINLKEHLTQKEIFTKK